MGISLDMAAPQGSYIHQAGGKGLIKLVAELIL